MPSFVAYPPINFSDAFAQPSDIVFGRRLSVIFDTNNVFTLASDGITFSDSMQLVVHPVVLRVFGTTIEGPTFEDFNFVSAGLKINGDKHFTSFTGISNIDGYIINAFSSFGIAEVEELLPINLLDDGYNNDPYVQFTGYGSGIFLFQTTLKDGYGNNVDPGFGGYRFNYDTAFQIPFQEAPNKLFIGNNAQLQNALDGIIDEVKLTSAIATKTRTRTLTGSYDISAEATTPISSVPDAKTLTLLHLDDNSQFILDAIRDPLNTAHLDDSVLATIVSLKHNRSIFINYINSLQLTGNIVDGALDKRTLAEQLFDLVSALDIVHNIAKYFRISGHFFPSEITVNSNFKFGAVFSGEQYSIEKTNLINNDQGSIELWIAPLFNLLGDFSRRVYLDSINHNVLGVDGQLFSATANTIVMPNGIRIKSINSIKLFHNDNNFDFSPYSSLTNDGMTIILTKHLPQNQIPVVIDYIPLSATNDRLTLYKDEDNNLVFSISANGILYHLEHNISNWKKNEWHRVMATWKTNDKKSLNRLNLFVDGTESTIIKYGEGFLFNTFVFKQEHQATISTKIPPQNIQFVRDLDRLYIGSTFDNKLAGFCRMANLRISFIERQPIIDNFGNKIDFDFDGGSKSATPSISDSFTNYLEDFDPMKGFVDNFATIQDPKAGAHDLRVNIRDDFNLVRGIDNGQIERLLKELINIIRPAESRIRVLITNKD